PTRSPSIPCTTAAIRRADAPRAPARSPPASTRAPAAGGGRTPRTRSAGYTCADADARSSVRSLHADQLPDPEGRRGRRAAEEEHAQAAADGATAGEQA